MLLPRCLLRTGWPATVCLLALSVLFSSRVCADDLLPADRPIPEAIDHYIDAGLQAANVRPAERAADTTLIRRTMLDLIGRIPTGREAQEYAQSEDPKKRAALVQRLLTTPDFAQHQATAMNARLTRGVKGADLRAYLLKAFQENRPWDVMFREMLLGQADDKKQEGALRYVRALAKDLDKLTNKTSVDFFGVNISCARCHDHPEAPEWTQAHFFGMKSFFARTFDNGGLVGERDYGKVNYKTTEGEQKAAQLMFLTGRVVPEPDVKEPDAKAKKAERKRLADAKKKKVPPPPPKFSRRAKLVETALSKTESHYFARAIVNRLWARLIGHGLVTPVDQMHPENPPSHPELLDWLARDLRNHKYDLQRLIRGIVLSETYARSSSWESSAPRPAPETFGVGVVRPLGPAQYAVSLRIATYRPDYFSEAKTPEEAAKRWQQVRAAARGFASLIEQPREGFQISVSEALLFSNNVRIRNDFLRDHRDSLVASLQKLKSDRELIEQLVWTMYGRPVEKEERHVLAAYLKARKDRREAACRQLVWALLTSSELRFNY